MPRKAKVKAKTAKTKTRARKATKPAAKAVTKTAAPAASRTRTKPPRGMTRNQTKGYQKLLLSKKQELAEAYKFLVINKINHRIEEAA